MSQRFEPVHNDVKASIRSALGGGTAWSEQQINDTGFIVGWLANNSTDYFQALGECTHERNLQTAMDDLHIHYILEQSATAGQTIVWTVYYLWLNPGTVVPAISGWTNLGTVTQVLGNHAAYYYNIFQLGTNLSAPSSELYGSMILFKATRGNGTYTGRIGILEAGAHTPINRQGSVNTASD